DLDADVLHHRRVRGRLDRAGAPVLVGLHTGTARPQHLELTADDLVGLSIPADLARVELPVDGDVSRHPPLGREPVMGTPALVLGRSPVQHTITSARRSGEAE